MEKKAVVNFREKANFLQAIFEEITDIIFVKDLKGRYLLINEAGARSFGKSPEEIIGRDNSILNLPPEAAKVINESERQVILTGKTLTYEIEIEIEGIVRSFLSTNRPYREPFGKTIGTIGIARDMTDRKLAEEKLRAELAYRKPIEEAMLAGVAAVDLTGKLIYVNSAFCKMVGWSEQELLGKNPPYPYWAPEEIESNLKSIKRRIDTGNTSEFHTQFQRQNGERFPVLIKTAPLTDGYGKEIGFVATVLDITVQKSAESRVQESHQILERFINACPLAIMVFDSAGIVKLANPAAEQIFGWSKKELIGRFNPIISEEKRNEFLSNIYSVIDGNPMIGLEARRQKKSGAPIDLSLWAVSYSDENGNPCVLSISADITEKRKMENEILKIKKLESLGILAGGIAHDFNNILTAIIGNISLAKSFVESKEQLLSRLNEAERASLRASDLAQQLLTFSKGGAPIKKAVSIQKLIQHSVDFALMSSNVQSQLFFQEGLWPVEVDEGQMNQVIQNLVINAKQAMPSGGTIRIEAKNLAVEEQVGQTTGLRKGDYLLISVQDHGIGISKDDLSKVFDPYFTTKPKGSGLGLSITHSIIQRHKGYITAESKPGLGTIFFIYLPASPQASVPQEKLEEEVMLPGQGKVLVMDDEESVLNVAAEMLRHLGYEVNLARDGSEAVHMYQKAKSSDSPFDVIILDLIVPGDMGGIEILRRLREIDPQVRVIVSSGYSDDPAMTDFESFGFTDYLKKPYRAYEVSQTIKRVLKTRRLNDRPAKI